LGGPKKPRGVRISSGEGAIFADVSWPIVKYRQYLVCGRYSQLYSVGSDEWSLKRPDNCRWHQRCGLSLSALQQLVLRLRYRVRVGPGADVHDCSLRGTDVRGRGDVRGGAISYIHTVSTAAAAGMASGTLVAMVIMTTVMASTDTASVTSSRRQVVCDFWQISDTSQPF